MLLKFLALQEYLDNVDNSLLKLPEKTKIILRKGRKIIMQIIKEDPNNERVPYILKRIDLLLHKKYSTGYDYKLIIRSINSCVDENNLKNFIARFDLNQLYDTYTHLKKNSELDSNFQECLDLVLLQINSAGQITNSKKVNILKSSVASYENKERNMVKPQEIKAAKDLILSYYKKNENSRCKLAIADYIKKFRFISNDNYRYLLSIKGICCLRRNELEEAKYILKILFLRYKTINKSEKALKKIAEITYSVINWDISQGRLGSAYLIMCQLQHALKNKNSEKFEKVKKNIENKLKLYIHIKSHLISKEPPGRNVQIIESQKIRISFRRYPGEKSIINFGKFNWIKYRYDKKNQNFQYLYSSPFNMLKTKIFTEDLTIFLNKNELVDNQVLASYVKFILDLFAANRFDFTPPIIQEVIGQTESLLKKYNLVGIALFNYLSFMLIEKYIDNGDMDLAKRTINKLFDSYKEEAKKFSLLSEKGKTDNDHNDAFRLLSQQLFSKIAFMHCKMGHYFKALLAFNCTDGFIKSDNAFKDIITLIANPLQQDPFLDIIKDTTNKTFMRTKETIRFALNTLILDHFKKMNTNTSTLLKFYKKSKKKIIDGVLCFDFHIDIAPEQKDQNPSTALDMRVRSILPRKYNIISDILSNLDKVEKLVGIKNFEWNISEDPELNLSPTDLLLVEDKTQNRLLEINFTEHFERPYIYSLLDYLNTGITENYLFVDPEGIVDANNNMVCRKFNLERFNNPYLDDDPPDIKDFISEKYLFTRSVLFTVIEEGHFNLLKAFLFYGMPLDYKDLKGISAFNLANIMKAKNKMAHKIFEFCQRFKNGEESCMEEIKSITNRNKPQIESDIFPENKMDSSDEVIIKIQPQHKNDKKKGKPKNENMPLKEIKNLIKSENVAYRTGRGRHVTLIFPNGEKYTIYQNSLKKIPKNRKNLEKIIKRNFLSK
ncbi:hypothetical protein ACFLZV_06810 [Candidatus Margulisiibacteriota bacterium]